MCPSRQEMKSLGVLSMPIRNSGTYHLCQSLFAKVPCSSNQLLRKSSSKCLSSYIITLFLMTESNSEYFSYEFV